MRLRGLYRRPAPRPHTRIRSPASRRCPRCGLRPVECRRLSTSSTSGDCREPSARRGGGEPGTRRRRRRWRTRRAAPATAAQSAPGIWERSAGDTRDNPYLFQKSPTILIGNNAPIVVPRGRTNIDFECELGIVVGKRAKYVPVGSAGDYIFGYTARIMTSRIAAAGAIARWAARTG